MPRNHLERIAASAVACAAALAIAAPAQGAVQVTSMVATPVTPASTCSVQSAPTPAPQSGAFQDFCLALALDGGADDELGNIPGLGDDAQEMHIALPAGEVGSPRAAATCTPQQFHTTSGCPSATQLGTMSAAVDGLVPLSESLLQGRVFNLTPTGTEAARLGLEIDVALGGLPPIPVIRLESEIRLRAGDGGLDAVVTDLPREVLGLSIEMRRLALRLWGAKADHPSLVSGFMSTPTDCSRAASTSVQLTSYSGDRTSASAAFTPTDCGSLPFTQASRAETGRRADAPTAASVIVDMPAPAEPRTFAQVDRAKVVLPAGFELSPAAASDGTLAGCSDAQVNRAGAGPAACPPGSVIGEVAFDSPLLAGGAISGPIYLGESAPGKKIRFFAVAEAGPEADAIRVKLEAVATVDPQTGQVTTELTGLPPVPFTSFRFSFRGGDHAIIASPRSCGTGVATTTLTPVSGQTAVTSEAQVTIDEGCEDPARFAPELTAAADPPQAGADTRIVTAFSRPDGHARISSATVRLPPGLAGRLGAATLCPRDAAPTGVCPADSRVGSVRATAGAGPAPLMLTGDAFLTEGAGGDPAGLTLSVPVRLGPLDLGLAVAVGRLRVRPADQGLDLVVEHIPQRQEGISTAIRSMEVRLDRPGFGVNATSCAPQQITATIGSDLGATAELAVPYQAEGCDGLPFAPKLDATLTGGAKQAAVNGHPGLSTTVSQGSGQSNTRRVQITLPAGISVDVDRIDRACPLATFEAGKCPAQSTLGRASAVTPLLPSALSGPVTMVAVPGSPLPELRIALGGLLPITLSGRIAFGADNRIVTTVEPVPDVPLTRFELAFDAGSNSLLQATRDLCAQARLPMQAVLDAQAGGRSTATIDAAVAGCEPSATLKVGALRDGRPALDLRVAGGRTRVTSTQLTLPKGIEFQRAALVRKRLRISASGLRKGAKATVTVTGTSVRVTVPKGQSAKVVRLRLPAGTVRVSSRLRRQGRPRLTFRISSRTTAGTRRAVSNLRIRPAASR